MSIRGHETYDVVGIGFGPSNLSLAIALEEQRSTGVGRPLTAAFLERQPAFGWHRNMLLPSAGMQIAFLKDLATFRNPVSRFSFVSFLHESQRLVQFVNNQTFYPSRQEFHQYLEWAAANFAQDVDYGSDVVAIRLPRGVAAHTADHFELEVRTAEGSATKVVKARNVAISTGLVPRMPEGVARDDRVWHSSEFLTKFRQTNPDDLKSVAVVGAGQSAAEIARFLYDALPHARVSAIIPSYGYAVADDTPFANQVFDPETVDEYYFGSDRARDAFWRYHKNTNYSVVDGEVIRDLYRRSYDDDVTSNRRLHILNLSRVTQVRRTGNVAHVRLDSMLSNESQDLDVDALVFATGYDAMEPTALLGDIDRFCLRDSAGRYRVERDYRIATTPEVAGGIYLQGGTEHTHGLTSSLLSNLAIRSGEIASSILGGRVRSELECPLSVEAA